MCYYSLRFIMWSFFADVPGPMSLRTFALGQPGAVLPGNPISGRRVALVIPAHAPILKQVTPTDEDPPPTSVDPQYQGVPTEFQDSASPSEGRLVKALRDLARMRDGNVILQFVCDNYHANYLNPGQFSQDLLTAMTQLVITGSNAFAKWSAQPIDLTYNLVNEKGMPADVAAGIVKQITDDLNTAQQAVRNPLAGKNWDSLRQGLTRKWIAVSGEDDPPDYPVNVSIAPYPQFHLPITVPIRQASWGAGNLTSMDLDIRYIIASSGEPGTNPEPYMPPGNEVILYIHGEGSRAEEACDLIPKLFEVGAAVGRSFTVIALDLPGFGYTTTTNNGIRQTPRHLDIASMPPTSGVSGLVETSSFQGSPILDFVEDTIAAFVEKLISPFGNPITAVVGGSLGGHMALRMAARSADWVRNVIAWSPASVMEHEFFFLVLTLSNRVFGDPKMAERATDGDPWPALEAPDSRQKFFKTVFDDNTMDPPDALGVSLLAGALIGAFPPLAMLGAGTVGLAIEALQRVPPQPKMWYREDWPSSPPTDQGRATVTYINEARWERQEVYNTNFRQWHWRICEEMVGYTFDPKSIYKPLQLMVGEKDDYPRVHFFQNVSSFPAAWAGPGRAITVPDTGHSIHNERPRFLAKQIVNFPRNGSGSYPIYLGALDGKGRANSVYDGNVTLDKIDSGYNATIESLCGSITINQKIDQHSTTNLTAHTTFNLQQTIDQHSVATITATGDIVIGKKIDQHSSATITSASGKIDIGQKVDAGSSATLNAGTTVHIGEAIDQSSNVTIVAQGGVTIDKKIDQHSTANITCGSIWIGEKIDQHANVTIVAQGDVVIGQKLDQHTESNITSANGSIAVVQGMSGNARATLRAPNGTITMDTIDGGCTLNWSAQSLNCPHQNGTVNRI